LLFLRLSEYGVDIFKQEKGEKFVSFEVIYYYLAVNDNHLQLQGIMIIIQFRE